MHYFYSVSKISEWLSVAFLSPELELLRSNQSPEIPYLVTEFSKGPVYYRVYRDTCEEDWKHPQKNAVKGKKQALKKATKL